MLLSTNCPFFKEISSTTALELLWNPKNDQLQVKNNTTKLQQTNSTASTKRKVFATTPLIFDPLGLLSCHGMQDISTEIVTKQITMG